MGPRALLTEALDTMVKLHAPAGAMHENAVVEYAFWARRATQPRMSSASSRFDVGNPIDPAVESFEAFYRREYRSVLALATVLTSDRSQAEDLAQESFLAAYLAWSGISNPDTWIRATVSNKAMTWWRRIYAGRRAMSHAVSAQHEVGEIPEDTHEFWAEVRRLPRRQAQTLALYYLEDRSTQEIARVLGCEESTVRIHLTRGRRTLASRLEVPE